MYNSQGIDIVHGISFSKWLSKIQSDVWKRSLMYTCLKDKIGDYLSTEFSEQGNEILS